MNNNTTTTTTIPAKIFIIPRCLEASPQVFGLSVQTAVITLGFALMGLIMIAKSLLLTFVILVLAIVNLKLEKKFKKEGGVIPYLMLLSKNQESIRVNCTVKSLIQMNKNGK